MANTILHSQGGGMPGARALDTGHANRAVENVDLGLLNRRCLYGHFHWLSHEPPAVWGRQGTGRIISSASELQVVRFGLWSSKRTGGGRKRRWQESQAKTTSVLWSVTFAVTLQVWVYEVICPAVSFCLLRNYTGLPREKRVLAPVLPVTHWSEAGCFISLGFSFLLLKLCEL